MQNPPSGSPSSRNGNVPLGSCPLAIVAPLSQRFDRPAAQNRQCPQAGRKLVTTWSPGATAVTPGPDGRDDAGALVPADDRVPPARVGVPQVLVGVAQAGVGHLDQHLAGPRVEDLEVDDLVLGLRRAQDRCSRPHGRHAAWGPSDGRRPPLDPRRGGACGTIGGCLPQPRPNRPRPAPAAAPSWSGRPTAPPRTRAPPASCARLFEVTLRGLREEADTDAAAATVIRLADAAYDAQHPDPGDPGRLRAARPLEALGADSRRRDLHRPRGGRRSPTWPLTSTSSIWRSSSRPGPARCRRTGRPSPAGQ